MTCTPLLARSTAIALCLPASAVYADLTGADVWADWKSYMASTGYNITASEVTSGDTLTVTDLAMSVALGESPDEGSVRIALERMQFVDRADGSVAIELPATYAIDLNLKPESGETVVGAITLSQDAPVMTASGEPGDLTYDYAAASVGMTLTSLSVNGVPVGQDIAKFDLILSDIAYVTTSVMGDLRSMAQTMTVSEVRYDMRFADPVEGGAFKLTGTTRGVTFDGTLDMPVEIDPQDTNEMLSAGFAVDGEFSTTGGNYDLSFSGPDGSGTANSTSAGGDIAIAMSADGLVYDVAQRDVDFNLLLTEFPLPLSFSADVMGARLSMPLQKAPEPQDFGLGITLTDFTVADVIWGLFDPSGQLPRDPASLVLDLSGQAKVLFDFLDPAQAAVLDQSGAIPGELNALTLNTLDLEAAGAKLTGKGDFTFDNSDLVTFDGMPRPTGALDLTLVGGSALLDKLVGMGLVPEEQAMGARMMMGMFAVPGDTPDTLNSRIEVTPEGQVLANGQRIR